MKNILTASLLSLFVFVFFSCQSTETTSPVEPAVVEQKADTPKDDNPEPPKEAAPSPDVVVSDETGFEVSAEVYQQTFNEMKALIEKLNGIISSKNYEKWKQYLSDSYIKTYNDQTKLKTISEQSQILADNGIVLENLKDYFEWVVVPSRSKASLDDLVFLDDSHLTAYMVIKDNRTILYQLEKIDGKWLISVW